VVRAQTLSVTKAGWIAVVGMALMGMGLTACTTPPVLAGPDLAAGCAALKGAIVSAADVDRRVASKSQAAEVISTQWLEATPLSVAAQGPTPAARVQPAMPAHCKVVGRIAATDPQAQPITFQVNLPGAWNGRLVQWGGGGFNGVLITGQGLAPAQRFDIASPLGQGYVTVGTDSGHQNKPGESPMAFALNAEMLVNFAHAAYPKVRNVAHALTLLAYGRAPATSYFVGSSEGGREGLLLAQRYPWAFDGIFSRVPVVHWTGLQFAGARNGMALMDDAWLQPAHVKLVHDAALAACDGADGLADQIISNPTACLKQFDLAALRCAPNAVGDSCLTAAQVKAVVTLRSPFTFPFALANGLTTYPGWGLGGEDTRASGPAGGWRAWWSGNAAPRIPPTQGNGISWVYGAGALQFFYAQDAKADVRTITPQSVEPRVREVSALMDATNPDLSAFHARGGRLIVLEHLADYAQSPYAGIQYVESVQRTMGAVKAREVVRLFAAPGVDHVGTGAPAYTDPLRALVMWVEAGRAPTDLTVAEQEAKLPLTVSRSRPLCEWPMWPRYKAGDARLDTSFECVK
jgi:hypothetical protein